MFDYPDEDLPFDTHMLDRLAEVSIRVGLNLQEGQDLIITASVESLPLEALCGGIQKRRWSSLHVAFRRLVVTYQVRACIR